MTSLTEGAVPPEKSEYVCPMHAHVVRDVPGACPIRGRRLELRAVAWIEFALASPVVLWGAWPFFLRAWQSLVNRRLNMFTLFGLGIGVAYGYSVAALVLPGIFPPAFQGRNGVVAVYFEAAAVIVALVLLGQVLELGARRETNAAIRALLHLAPNRLLNYGRKPAVVRRRPRTSGR